MYLPSFFREDRLDVLHEFIKRQQPMPWSVDDAPESCLQTQLRAIDGFVIEIRDIVGKFKASQNRSDLDELIRPPR